MISPLSGDGSPRFAIAIWLLSSDGDEHAGERRAARLEQHLWRIALEVQASGVLGSGAHRDGPPDDGLRDLSSRQLEILRRPVRGERVPTIARDLFLSQSTVRNHLSAMYRKVGCGRSPSCSPGLHHWIAYESDCVTRLPSDRGGYAGENDDRRS